jgi:hypothetical protein
MVLLLVVVVVVVVHNVRRSTASPAKNPVLQRERARQSM